MSPREREERIEQRHQAVLAMTADQHEERAARIYANGSSNSPGGLAGVDLAVQTHLLWALLKRGREVTS